MTKRSTNVVPLFDAASARNGIDEEQMAFLADLRTGARRAAVAWTRA